MVGGIWHLGRQLAPPDERYKIVNNSPTGLARPPFIDALKCQIRHHTEVRERRGSWRRA